jgi:hypothetical protein
MNVVENGTWGRQISARLVIMEVTQRAATEDRGRPLQITRNLITRNRSERKMAKATRATDSTTPKKRTTKAKSAAENGTEVVAKVTTPALAHETKSSTSIEEKIRARAYELFLQRGGYGGSPEQDWLQAVAEVHGQSVA